MGTLYKCKVININTRLRIRSGPSLSASIVGYLYNGNTIMVDGMSTSSDGYVWYKHQGSNKYSCSKTGGGEQYIKIIETLSDTKPVTPPAPTNTASTANYNSIKLGAITVSGGATKLKSTNEASKVGDWVNIDESDDDVPLSDSISNKKSNYSSKTEEDNYGIFYLHSNAQYPKRVSGSKKYPVYNYYMDYDSKLGYSQTLKDMYRIIKKNMNIPSYYSRQEINKLYHSSFNRFHVEHPDVYLRTTIPVVIFTRPDLNLFTTSGEKNDMIASDVRCNYTLENNRYCARLLTDRGTGKELHKFNPLLSNLAQSLEVADDSLDSLETGETFTGYKMSYAKHNIKSITSGNLTIKFKETFDLAVTHTHQLWVDYESNVYKGIFEPKREYIYNKELDYACDIYYFLLDSDGETIKFWSKYYGCYPLNVPKSVYSYDFGSRVEFPELQVSYNYIYKEDLSPTALVEFNMNAGTNGNKTYDYVPAYNATLGQCNTTWVGTPFISSFEYSNGLSSKVQGFKLLYRKN